jgi:hypothetical protein
MRNLAALLFASALAGCPAAAPDVDSGVDAGMAADAPADAGRDVESSDAAGAPRLAELRDRLFGTMTATPCATWASMDASRRAVFLTLTHRLFLSRTPDGMTALDHLDRLHLVLGGGSSGSTCGGAENNRLFLSMDTYLWERMVETWSATGAIEDGGGGVWVHTRDAAGPHDPFDASIETDSGLRCTLLIETSGSRPPTAQAHFFLAGSAVRVERGAGISLDVDPEMLEIDHDYNCIHDSNPTCRDFEDRYRTHYGDFECDWIPSSCTSTDTGCYRSAL